MSKIYLINQETFKDFEDISINVKPERMLVFVKKMQDLDLKPFLGHALYYDFLKWVSYTGFGIANIDTETTTADDGKYSNQDIVSTSGEGSGAKATFIVADGKVTSVIQTLPGIGFDYGDTFTCAVVPGAIFSVDSLAVAFVEDTPTVYINLFNGVDYVDTHGHDIEYEGMIPMLVYFAFARFVEVDSIRFTATGPVIKNHDDVSRGLTPTELTKFVQQQRSVANAHANEVTKFMYDHKKDIPLWHFDQRNTSSRQSGPRIRGIDKTKYNYPGTAGGATNYGYDDITGGLI